MTLERKDREEAMPGHSVDEKKPWLTPQFGFQLMTYFASTLILLGGFAWSIKSDVRSVKEEQMRQSAAIEEVRRQLPNKGELDQKIERIIDRVQRLEQYDEKTEARWDNVNTRLARKGM